jgi:archaellum biogenesis protein FlaJ (TadC family)
MEVLILYGLLIIFFLLFPLLVVLFAREMEPSLQHERNNKTSTSANMASYGLLGTLFALLVVLTFFTYRRS